MTDVFWVIGQNVWEIFLTWRGTYYKESALKEGNMQEIYRQIVVTLLAAFLSLAAVGQDSVYVGDAWRKLPRGKFARSVRTRGTAGVEQWLLRFDKIPSAGVMRSLENQGVRGLSWYSGTIWRALVPVGKQPQAEGLVSTAKVPGAWKIARVVAQRAAQGREVRILLRYDAHEVQLKEVLSHAARCGGAVEGSSERGAFVSLRILGDRLEELAAPWWVLLLDTPQEPSSVENQESRNLLRVNAARGGIIDRSTGLTGQGVRIGIWDGDVELHADFENRLHVMERTMPGARAGHGTHVAGTIVGGGAVDNQLEGVAPNAELYSYNFAQVSTMPDANEIRDAMGKYGVSISSNSHGVALNSYCEYYDEFSYNVLGWEFDADRLVYEKPSLFLNYSVGNDRQACGGAYPYGQTVKRVKNAMLVGAVDHMERLAAFSSFGPMDDGRLAPHVVALGVDVMSTAPYGGYVSKSGTSMACPAVSGMAALLTEQYKRQHGDAMPDGALLRAIIMNTARDIEAKGPDYMSGFGVANIEAAVEAIRKGWFVRGEAAQGAESTHAIRVPAGAARLRVMLIWDDPVAVKTYAYGESALRNDLDLTVDGELPWVLDKSNPSAAARRGEDRVNPFEQVTLEMPAAGDRTARVVGMRVEGAQPQRYWLVWYIDTPRGSRFVAPRGGEMYVSGQGFAIRWEHEATGGEVQWRSEHGDWETLGQSEESNILVVNALPAAMAGKCRLRVLTTDGKVVRSEAFFVVPRPVLRAEKAAAGNDALAWDAVGGAEAYRVYYLDAQGELSVPIELGTAVQSYDVALAAQAPRQTLWYVSAVVSGVEGARSVGVNASKGRGFSLLADALPWEDHFGAVPSPYCGLELGPNMMAYYTGVYEGKSLEKGSNLLLVYPKDTTRAQPYVWNATMWPWQQQQNRATLRVGPVDMAALQGEVDKLQLYIELRQQYDSTSADCQVRVLADGKELQELSLQPPEAPYSFTRILDGLYSPARMLRFDVSEYIGKSVSIEIEMVGKSVADLTEILRYGFDIPGTQSDAQLVDFKVITLAEEEAGGYPLEVLIKNVGSSELRDIPVGYRDAGNGGDWVIERIAGPVQPGVVVAHKFARNFPFKVKDGEPLGETFSLEARVFAQDDVNQKNDAQSRRATIYKPGVYPYPHGDYVELPWGGGVYNDPKLELSVGTSEVVLVPQNGPYEDFAADQQATLTLRPKEAGRYVEVSFVRYDIGVDDKALFYVLTNTTKPIAQVREKAGAEPLVFRSELGDGSVVLQFAAAWNAITTGKDWEIRARTVPYPVAYPEVTSIAAAPMDSEGKVRLTATISWDGDAAFEEMNWSLMAGGKTVYSGFEPRMEAKSSKKIELDPLAFTPNPGYVTLTANVHKNESTPGSTYVTTIRNDRYCDANNGTKAGLGIETVTFGETTLTVRRAQADGTETGINYDHTLKSLIPVRGYDGEREVRVTLGVAAEKGGVAYEALIAVDWDGNGKFEAGETSAPVAVDATAAEQLLSLAVPAGQPAGEFRVRIIYRPASGAPTVCGAMEGADVVDLQVKYEAADTRKRDLNLKSIDDEQLQLPKAEAYEVAFTIENAGDVTMAEATVNVSVDGSRRASETLTLGLASKASGQYTIALPDALAAGAYTIRVEIENRDDNTANNALEKSVRILQEGTGIPGNYYISMQHYARSSPEVERIDLGTLGGVGLGASSSDQKSVTIEGWFRVDDDAVNNLIRGKKLTLGSTGTAMNYFPRHALLCALEGSSGQRTSICTEEGTFTPNQWHHVALSFYYGAVSRKDNWVVYIDGKLQPVEIEGSVLPRNTANEPFYVGDDLHGGVKLLRVWKRRLEAGEIEALAKLPRALGAEDHRGSLIGEWLFGEGLGSNCSKDTQSGRLAYIVSQRDYDVAGEVWCSVGKLLRGVAVEGDAWEYTDVTNGQIAVNLPEGYNGEKLRVRPLLDWAQGVTVADADGNALPEWIEVTLPYTLYVSAPGITGSTMREAYTVVAGTTRQGCAIKSLTLARGEQAVLEGNTWYVTVPYGTELSRVKAAVVADAGAKVLLPSGVEFVNHETELDLREGLQLRVVSENKRYSTGYNVMAIVKGAELTAVSFPSVNLVYGERTPVSVDAALAKSVSVCFAGEGVARVEDGNAVGIGVGATKGYAMLAEQGVQEASNAVEFDVTVTRRAAELMPIAITVDFGARLADMQPSFDWTALVWPSDSVEMAGLAFKLYDAYGQEVQTQEWLAAGTYTWKPVAATVETKNYEVTLKEAAITVSDANACELTLASVDGTGALGGVVLMLTRKATGEVISLTTDATSGEVAIRLPSGEYAYAAKKEQYTPVEATFTVGTGTQREEVALTASTQRYAVRFVAGANGNLTGELEQSVEAGGATSEVVAMPAMGHRLARWEDGDGVSHGSANPFSVRDVAKAADYTAVFERERYWLRVLTNSADAVVAVDGQRGEQYDAELEYGAVVNTISVDASAAAGFQFSCWSDGEEQAAHSALASLERETRLVAMLSPIVPLPVNESFSDDVFANGTWLQLDRYGAGRKFTAGGALPTLHMQFSDGQYLYADAQGNRSETRHAAYLYSPWYDLGTSGERIALSFDYYLYNYSPRAEFAVECRAKEGDAWQPVGKLTKSALEFTWGSVASRFEGHLPDGMRYAQIRIRYDAGQDGYVLLDNLSLALAERMVYIAPIANGSVTLTAGGAALDLTQQQEPEAEITIETTADAGYRVTGIRVVRMGDKEDVLAATAGASLVFTMPGYSVEVIVETVKEYALAIAAQGEGTVRVVRGAEELKEGETLLEGDRLKVDVMPAIGWRVQSLLMNGMVWANGAEHVVASDVKVEVVFEQSTPVESELLASVEVSPALFTNRVWVRNAERVARYALLNASGIQVAGGENSGLVAFEVKADGVPNGVYLLHLAATNGTERVVKLVKE